MRHFSMLNGGIQLRPLADEIRPADLDEVVGQKHILGDNGLLRRIIESGNIPNMVFYLSLIHI